MWCSPPDIVNVLVGMRRHCKSGVIREIAIGRKCHVGDSLGPRAGAASEYVASCAGSSQTALTSLVYVWQSRETQEVLEWLCDFNRSHPRVRSKATAFEMWQPRYDARALTTFLGMAAP